MKLTENTQAGPVGSTYCYSLLKCSSEPANTLLPECFGPASTRFSPLGGPSSFYPFAMPHSQNHRFVSSLPRKKEEVSRLQNKD